MKKTILILLLTWVVCTSAIFFLLKGSVRDCSTAVKLEKEKYKPYLGKTFVLDSDTLTIVDYSLLTETFVLSNGKEINYRLVSLK